MSYINSPFPTKKMVYNEEVKQPNAARCSSSSGEAYPKINMYIVDFHDLPVSSARFDMEL